MAGRRAIRGSTRVAVVGTIAVLAVALGAMAWTLRSPDGDADQPLPAEARSSEPASHTPTEAAAPTEPSGAPTPRPSPTPIVPPAPIEPAEVRAVWIHLFDDTLKDAASITRMVDRAADANANTLIVEVVRRQDAYHDSDVLPRTTDPELDAGLDVLDHVLERAHARDLAVHAWVPVLTAHHHVYDDLPAPPGWVWTDHGPDAPEDRRWITRLADGTWSDHLDPGVPAVRAHVAAVMAEIARDYPVDGVHLDYVRYTSRDAGYHPQALARYRAATGTSGTPSPDDPAWSAWRREQVTTLVHETRAAVEAAAPDVAFTAAVVAQGEAPTSARPFAATRGHADYFQDWVRWADDGLFDALFPMVYFDERTHGDWFDGWAGFLDWFAGEVDPLLVGGQAGYLNTTEASLDQLQRLRDGTDGTALYSFQQTVDREPFDALFERLPRQVWAEPARNPLRR